MTLLLSLFLNFCRRYFEREERVSRSWLRRHDQAQTRVEFHGVRMQWPVKKLINESARMNRHRLRRSA